jgi:hypothetical protein
MRRITDGTSGEEPDSAPVNAGSRESERAESASGVKEATATRASRIAISSLNRANQPWFRVPPEAWIGSIFVVETRVLG